MTTFSPGNTKSQEWLDTMNKMGYGFRAYPCDVADWDSCAACAAKVVAEAGPIDVLVNNAGITRDMTFRKMDKGAWDAVIRTNLDSVFNMTKQVCDGMVDRNWGRVINIASTSIKEPIPGLGLSNSVRAAVANWAKTLASELGPHGEAQDGHPGQEAGGNGLPCPPACHRRPCG